MQLAVKVVPGARKESIEWYGEGLKIKVRAAPERGQANAAVEALLCARLGLPATAVRIVAGFTSARKRVAISDLSPDQLRTRLGLD